MIQTTEPRVKRMFHFLRKDGQYFRIPAETICEETGRGTTFTLKRGGKKIGSVQGDILAWRIEEPEKAEQKSYSVEIQQGEIIRISADSREILTDEDGVCQVFKRESEIVGTIYNPRYSV